MTTKFDPEKVAKLTKDPIIKAIWGVASLYDIQQIEIEKSRMRGMNLNAVGYTIYFYIQFDPITFKDDSVQFCDSMADLLKEITQRVRVSATEGTDKVPKGTVMVTLKFKHKMPIKWGKIGEFLWKIMP